MLPSTAIIRKNHRRPSLGSEKAERGQSSGFWDKTGELGSLKQESKTLILDRDCCAIFGRADSLPVHVMAELLSQWFNKEFP